MITITTKSWKKYKPKLTSFLVSQTISQWIKLGILEEVKENKDSILEKLREELDMQMKWYQMEVDLKKNTVESREYQWLQLGKKYGLEFAINLLTSLETKKCDHVSDWVVYTSNPPQYKCSKCGVYSTEFMPIETKEEPQPQEDIELLPFKFQYANEWSSWTTLSQIGKHLELLTNAVNKLIKANKK